MICSIVEAQRFRFLKADGFSPVNFLNSLLNAISFQSLQQFNARVLHLVPSLHQISEVVGRLPISLSVAENG